MEDREKKRKELLQELARRFRDSASDLKSVARRIDTAARSHEENRHRVQRAGARLRECIEDNSASIPFTYLEYVEFGSAEEFKKFRGMDIITEDEIQTVNLDELVSKLQDA